MTEKGRDNVRSKRQILVIAFGLVILGLLFPQSAYAYIDLGTGSYIIQMLIAGAVGILFAVKMYWKNLISFLGGLFTRRHKDERSIEQQ